MSMNGQGAIFLSSGANKWNSGNIAVVMVGLPASGKTFTARNLSRYLRWLGVKTRNFSVARYRSRIVGEKLTADFFDPNNEENLMKRTVVADQALKDVIGWFEQSDGGQVAILDASNTQPQRRQIIHESMGKVGVRTVFLECLYSHSHEMAVAEHIKELRLTCPEYAHVPCDKAAEDFNRRLEYYRPHYVTVGLPGEESAYSYIKLVEGGQRILANKVCGYLPSRMLYYLMNLHHGSKRIFLFPLPEKPFALQETVRSARAFLINLEQTRTFSVWTETSLIGCAVIDIFKDHDLLTKPQLRGLDFGAVEGLTEEDIKNKYPEEYKSHCADPYGHRYPRAESYHDLTVRMENVMMELERDPTDVLIVADLSVLQCVYAYFLEIPNREIPEVKISQSQFIELRPKAYGVFERRISLETGTAEPEEAIFRPFAEC